VSAHHAWVISDVWLLWLRALLARAHGDDTAYRESPAVRAEPVTVTALVLRVVDGDTVDIRDDVRGRHRVRLLGIDTPETKKPGYTVGCWGPEASEFAKSTLLGQRVAFVTDPSQGIYDRYGRTLAYLDKADGRRGCLTLGHRVPLRMPGRAGPASSAACSACPRAG
jgi:endonuclease YncB( thermonuclease family)